MQTQPPKNPQDSKEVVGEVQRCESGPEVLKIQRDLIGKVWQSPEILKNQRGFIGDVQRCEGIWPRNIKATHTIYGIGLYQPFLRFPQKYRGGTHHTLHKKIADAATILLMKLKQMVNRVSHFNFSIYYLCTNGRTHTLNDM